MVLTGLDLGAWLTESGAVVLLYEYDEVTQVFIGHVVHPMREVRYGKDGRLVSCCFLTGESQTVEHEQKLHAALHLNRKLGDVDAIITVNQAEWMERSGEAVLAPHGDWVEITDPDHVLRAGIDHIFSYVQGGYVPVEGSAGRIVGALSEKGHKIRCLREHHPNFAPARRQDSAGAGIYDEVPPPIHPEITEEKLKEVADRKTLDDPLSRFNVPEPPAASIDVIPPRGYKFSIVTAESDWNIRGTHFEWSGDAILVFMQDECVGWVRDALSCVRQGE